MHHMESTEGQTKKRKDDGSLRWNTVVYVPVQTEPQQVGEEVSFIQSFANRCLSFLFKNILRLKKKKNSSYSQLHELWICLKKELLYVLFGPKWQVISLSMQVKYKAGQGSELLSH